jgi:C1A family cysteine protease
MMRMLGRRNFSKVQRKASGAGSDSGDIGPNTPRGPLDKRSAKYVAALAKLPKEFSWIKYDSPVRNQGECGSCYSLAAMTVYEVRLRIKTRMQDKVLYFLSPITSTVRR